MSNLLATGDHVQSYGLQGDVHRAFETGWQVLTYCGRRVTRYGALPEWPWEKTDRPLNCPECMEGETYDLRTRKPVFNYARCPFDGSAYVVITTVGYHGLDNPYPIYNFYCTICGDEFDDQTGERLTRLNMGPSWYEWSKTQEDGHAYTAFCPFDGSMMEGAQIAIGGSMDNPPEPVYIAYCQICLFDCEV